MKLYSLNIIIDNKLINKTSPILYRMEDNDTYDIISLCKNELLMNKIVENITSIMSLNMTSYISIIYYDTNDETYNTDTVYIANILDDSFIEEKKYEYLNNLSQILYEKTLNKKYVGDGDYLKTMQEIKNNILNNYNITNETYCNCIMSMINEDLDKISNNDIIQKQLLISVKKKYNELLNL